MARKFNIVQRIGAVLCAQTRSLHDAPTLHSRAQCKLEAALASAARTAVESGCVVHFHRYRLQILVVG